MREFLVSIFGEWGATVAQFLLTVVIVLALIGIAVSLVRRYSGVRIGGIGRGRVPRLAVVDEMPVDRRRRLVLVRRDNVEHLLLVGGPGDVVIETAIQRVRRPAQQPAQPAAQQAPPRPAAQPAAETPPAATAAEAPAAQPAPANEPIPFPAARGGWVRPTPGNERPALRTVERRPPEPPAAIEEAESPAAAFVPPEPPAPAPRPAPQRQPPPVAMTPAPPEPASEPMLPQLVAEEVEEPAPPALPAQVFAEEVEIDETQQATLDLGDSEAPATAEGELPPSPDEAAARVSDLEREMARLLDEITSRRTS